jgi:hypothetical protein
VIESATQLEGGDRVGKFALDPDFSAQKRAQRGRYPQGRTRQRRAQAPFCFDHIGGLRQREARHRANRLAFNSTAVTRARKTALLIAGLPGGSGEGQA